MDCSVRGILKVLGSIDKGVEKGKFTEKQHNKMSGKVISKCLKQEKNRIGSTCKNVMGATLNIKKQQWNKLNFPKLGLMKR